MINYIYDVCGGSSMELKDLNQIVVQTKERIADSFRNKDIKLNEVFKAVLEQLLHEKGDEVKYFEYSTVIKVGASSNNILITNQWFYLAYYVSEYLKILEEYKSVLMDIKVQFFENLTTKEFGELIKNQKDSEALDGELEIAIRKYFEDDEASYTFMKQFLTDYSWWNGQKSIDRHDFFVSPVLNIMGVVNNSHGYMADIVKLYSSSHELLAEADNMFFDYTIPEDADRVSGGKNIIIYGAPGTGKSRYVQDHYDNITRVVFHSDYSYYDFVGTYKPTPVYRVCENEIQYYNGSSYGTREPLIDYSYTSGPFLDVLIKAWQNPGTKYTLLIEELNRANAASVFGDVFQLLDRDKEGVSEYKITPSNELKAYISRIEAVNQTLEEGLYLPSNLDIVATMNSADQGVYVLDSAFKRRWNYKYIPLIESGFVHEDAIVLYSGENVKWKFLLKAINKKLKQLKINEDRLIGPYFISPDEIKDPNFMSEKLFIYLWDDVLRHKREQFFASGIDSYSSLIDMHYRGVDVLDVKDLIELDEYVDTEEEENQEE